MERPKEIEDGLHYLAHEIPPHVCNNFIKLVEYIQSLEKTQQCFDEILEYMNDDSVTWRDISDDIINNILKQHGFK